MSTALATLAGKLAERVGVYSVDPQLLFFFFFKQKTAYEMPK